VPNQFRYAGEYQDAESNLYYLRARYYDPATQQFLTVDPLVGWTEQAYAYVGGSPTNATDPRGLLVTCLSASGWTGLGAGAVGIVYWCSASNGDTGFVGTVGILGATVAGFMGSAQFMWSTEANSLEDLERWSVAAGIGPKLLGQGFAFDWSHSQNSPVNTWSCGLGFGSPIAPPIGEVHGGITLTKVLKKWHGGIPPTAEQYARYWHIVTGQTCWNDQCPPTTPPSDVCNDCYGDKCSDMVDNNCFGVPK
jgi:RHS repeat-associated protein